VLGNARERLEGALEEFDGVMKEVRLKNPFENARYEIQDQEAVADDVEEGEVDGEDRDGDEEEGNPFRDGAGMEW
jgi:hypothetical protein